MLINNDTFDKFMTFKVSAGFKTSFFLLLLLLLYRRRDKVWQGRFYLAGAPYHPVGRSRPSDGAAPTEPESRPEPASAAESPQHPASVSQPNAAPGIQLHWPALLPGRTRGTQRLSVRTHHVHAHRLRQATRHGPEQSQHPIPAAQRVRPAHLQLR